MASIKIFHFAAAAAAAADVAAAAAAAAAAELPKQVKVLQRPRASDDEPPLKLAKTLEDIDTAAAAALEAVSNAKEFIDPTTGVKIADETCV